MVETASTSETSVNYQTTRRNNPSSRINMMEGKNNKRNRKRKEAKEKNV
jgi:hypothetical protein